MKKRIAVFISALLILSCTRNLTQPQNISLYGNVRLLGQPAIDGIMVSLYPLAAADSMTVDATVAYPALADMQTQANIFDHRRAEALFTTTTDADGHYEFIDVPQATYNLVIEKRGYGWRYLYNVDGEAELPDVTLVREIRQAGVLNSYSEWPAYQHVVVTGNITVPANGALLIDKGAVIRFDGAYRISGEGQVNCFGSADDPVWFTSNTVGEKETQTYWAGISLAEAGTFKDFRADYARTAISARSTTLTVERGVFAEIIDTGIFVSRESTVDVSQSYFYSVNKGVLCETQSRGNVHHNIFRDISGETEASAVTANASVIRTTDNYFQHCARGVSMVYGASGDVTNNVFKDCGVGVYNFSFDRDIPYSIRENTLDRCSTYFIEIHHAAIPTIHANNFLNAGGQLYLYAYSQSLYFYDDLDARNNYWDGLPATEASRLITDERRKKEGGGDATWKILIEPVAGEIIADAFPR